MLCKLLDAQSITLRIDHKVLSVHETKSSQFIKKRDMMGRIA
jgi:hypothetical protein